MDSDSPESMVVGQFASGPPSGAEAHVDCWDFMYGLKPVPFKLTHY